jgi:hypothetical protein
LILLTPARITPLVLAGGGSMAVTSARRFIPRGSRRPSGPSPPAVRTPRSGLRAIAGPSRRLVRRLSEPLAVLHDRLPVEDPPRLRVRPVRVRGAGRPQKNLESHPELGHLRPRLRRVGRAALRGVQGSYHEGTTIVQISLARCLIGRHSTRWIRHPKRLLAGRVER